MLNHKGWELMNRRGFLQTGALGTEGLGVPLILLGVVICALSASNGIRRVKQGKKLHRE